MDDRLIHAGTLAVLAVTAAADTLGLRRYRARPALGRRLPFLT